MNACDIVVIGGGIHGVGVAQAAAAAGYRVALLEQTALAAGTSSRSSKLIHGGLRYLESGQFALVRESLRERRLLLRNAPELVQLRRFYLPVYRDTTRRPWLIRTGLAAYSVLGGLHRHSWFYSVPRRRWGRLDNLRTEGLQQVFAYRDARTDDAGLTRAVMASAVTLGAGLLCPARFVAARIHAGGVEVDYVANDRSGHIDCSVLVNAAGPWVNEVLARITPSPRALPVALVQGTHVTFDGELTQGVYYVEAPSDRRAVFVMPSREGILVGTTEKTFTGEPGAAQPTTEEVDYLRATYRHYFPANDHTARGQFAGLRVLPEATGAVFHRRRETVLHRDHVAGPRLLSVYGGKLTTYRATAEKVMARIRPVLGTRAARADTRTLPLHPVD